MFFLSGVDPNNPNSNLFNNHDDVPRCTPSRRLWQWPHYWLWLLRELETVQLKLYLNRLTSRAAAAERGTAIETHLWIAMLRIMTTT